MAFCKYCGKQLADGEVCVCPDAVNEVNAAPAAPAYQPAPEAAPAPAYNPAPAAPSAPAGGYYAPPAPKAPSAFGIAMKDVWSLFLNLFKKPASLVSNFVKTGTQNHAFIMLGIQAIAVTLLLLTFALKYNDTIQKANAASLAAAAGNAQYYQQIMNSIQQQQVNIFMIIIVGLFSPVILSLVFAGLKVLFVKMFKGATDFMTSLKATAVSGFVAVPFILVGILLALILTGENASIAYEGVFSKAIGGASAGFNWGILVALFGYLFGFILEMAVLPETCNLDNDKQIYAILITAIAMIFVFYLFTKLITYPLCETEMAKLIRQQAAMSGNVYYGG